MIENLNIIDNEIHFNGSINLESMSSLTKELLNMQKSILKSCKSTKRKFADIDDDTISIEIKPQNIKLFITRS